MYWRDTIPPSDFGLRRMNYLTKTIDTKSIPDIREVVSKLEKIYGKAEWVYRHDPIDELIACILSQHTSDANSLRAFYNLKRTYPQWELAANAPVHQLADVIRNGGLADSKAPRIQQALREIKEREGSYDLSRLSSMSDRDARTYLMSLHGVGPKTAAIVLCFSLNRPVIPVDTHIFRVAWRLGFVEKRKGEAKAHDILQALIPEDIIFRFHMALIRHGREVCKAQRPRCLECPLTSMCHYHFQLQTNDNPEDGKAEAS